MISVTEGQDVVVNIKGNRVAFRWFFTCFKKVSSTLSDEKLFLGCFYSAYIFIQKIQFLLFCSCSGTVASLAGLPEQKIAIEVRIAI